MNLVVGTFVTAVLGFVVTFIGQGLVTVYTSDNGWYIASRFPSEGTNAQKLDIYNQSSGTINDLYMIIPNSIDINSLISSTPIQVENVLNAKHESSESVVSVSLIPPRRLTTVVIPSAQGDVRLLNAEEKGLSQENSDELKSLVKAKMMEILISSAVFAVLMGMFFYLVESYNDKRVAWLKEQLERDDRNYRQLTSELQDAKEQITDIKSSSSKINLLLMSRLRDYAKELDFWRDIIKSICRRLPDADVEKVFDEVTRKLKTFGTLRKQPDFEHVRTLAEWMADDGRRSEGTNKGQF